MRRVVSKPWPLWLDHIFSTLSHQWYNFRRKVIKHKMSALIFSVTFVWSTSLSKNKSVRYYHKCKYAFTWSTRYSCQSLMKVEFSWQIVEKYSSTKFHENSQWEPSCSVRTDGQVDMTKLTATFSSVANAPKMCRNIPIHILAIWEWS
jgi:hypothetical protein